MSFCLSKTSVDSFIHKQKKHLLPVRRQSVDFIQKQNPPVSQLYKTGPIRQRSCKRAFLMAKHLRHKKLRILCIFRTVKHNKFCIWTNNLHILRIFIPPFSEGGFTGTGWPSKQCMQSSWRIKNRGFCLLYTLFQRSFFSNQKEKFILFFLIIFFICVSDRPEIYRTSI